MPTEPKEKGSQNGAPSCDPWINGHPKREAKGTSAQRHNKISTKGQAQKYGLETFLAARWAMESLPKDMRPRHCRDCRHWKAATKLLGLCVPEGLSITVVAEIGGHEVVRAARASACAKGRKRR